MQPSPSISLQTCSSPQYNASYTFTVNPSPALPHFLSSYLYFFWTFHVNRIHYYGMSCLASFIEHNIFEVHLCLMQPTSLACSFLLLNNILLYGCTNFIYLPVDGQLGYFHFLAITKKVLLRTFAFKTLCLQLSCVDTSEQNWWVIW